MAVSGVVFCALLAAGGLYYFQTQSGRGPEQPQGMEPPTGMGTEDAEYITASGTTAAGITEEVFELGELDSNYAPSLPW